MGYELVGQVWSPAEFRSYVSGLDLGWAEGVTMHHTSAPSLAQRPNGLTAQHLENLRHYYQNELGWSSGPHLFIDDDQIWGMSSLERRGVHAKSFNATHIGIEVLGDYDVESPETGRGHSCWITAAHCVRAILDATGWTSADVNGHRDDPKTSKTCPGKLVDMDEFRAGVDSLSSNTADREDDPSTYVTIERAELDAILEAIDWQLDKLRGL